MGLTAFLETAIGLGLVYLLASVLCSGVNEWLAQEFGRRGRFLREGLQNIIPDRWLYLRVINHPLVASLYRDRPGKPRTPSYIPSGNFAGAVLEMIRLKAAQLKNKNLNDIGEPVTFNEIRAAVIDCRRAGVSIADGLLPLIDSAEGNLEKAYKNIEGWYESEMERVTGWYKRYSRRLLLLIGLIVAVLCNLDTIQITTTLARSSSLRRSLADTAEDVVRNRRFAGVELNVTDEKVQVAQDQLSTFARGLGALEKEGLPVGFSCLSPASQGPAQATLSDIWRACRRNLSADNGGNWLLKIVGWLITAFAISLGAPFWFDLLNRLVDLRGAGRKPDSERRQPS